MKTKTKCPLEREEAQVLWDWAMYHPIAKHYLAPHANGGSRHKLEAYNMKRNGQVRAGVSDYFFAYPAHGKPGLWIELKRRDPSISKPTQDQLDWLEKMEAVGYEVAIAWGAEQAIAVIQEYLQPTELVIVESSL
jgi:hypothetical protein